MKYVYYEILSGKENMQKDADLLETAIKAKAVEPVFRLYGWSPACVSLGRNQKDDFLDYGQLSALGLDVVRRLTGGRALLHDNEITYSVICPASYLPHGGNVAGSYKDICQILINKFAEIGIELTLGAEKGVHTKFDARESLASETLEWCVRQRSRYGSRFSEAVRRRTAFNYCMLVSTGADLCWNGKKLIGSAQFRKEGYILQHGSILYDFNKELLEKIFKEPVSTDEITCIKEINPSLTKSDIVELLSNVNL